MTVAGVRFSTGALVRFCRHGRGAAGAAAAVVGVTAGEEVEMAAEVRRALAG